jgi:hypothetical protein
MDKYRQMHRQQGDLISLPLLFKTRKVGFKKSDTFLWRSGATHFERMLKELVPPLGRMFCASGKNEFLVVIFLCLTPIYAYEMCALRYNFHVTSK